MKNLILILLLSVLSSCIYDSKQRCQTICGVVVADVDTYLDRDFPQDQSFMFFKTESDVIIIPNDNYSYGDSVCVSLLNTGPYYKEC